MNHRWRRILLALPLSLALMAGLQAAVPEPAEAAVAKTVTKLLSRFRNGDVAYAKVDLEVRSSDDKARAHTKVWCQNSAGVQVACSQIRGNWLSAQYWSEGGEEAGWRDFIGEDIVLQDDYLEQWTVWYCSGQGPDQYRAKLHSITVKNRAGEQGGVYDAITPTWLGTICYV